MTMLAPGTTDPGRDDLNEGERCRDGLQDVLEQARREIGRLVGSNSVAIAQAVIEDVIEDAKQGKYLSAKFLFDAVGLLAIDAKEMDDPEGHESLTSLLFKNWQLAPQGGGITEVPDIALSATPPNEHPVEL